MISKSENTQKPKVNTWSIVTAGLYAVIGYFIGNEFSEVVGVLLTTVGITLGFIVARKSENTNIFLKIVILLMPVFLGVFVLALQKRLVATVTNTSLIGIWTAQDSKGVFTISIKDSSALLSVEPGLKNIEYQYQVNASGDSLALINNANGKLSWHIIKPSDNKIILDAGSGLLFRRISTK